ncbi:AAA family ATPase [Modicisalibacter tunisiensis]|uniref:AAA family ATPase n=1 Tax=Modicisalibacter tunisiensis TaxID=390637 RepID=A0ABS7X1I6_9GAMM|nr:AAA family ATPase [Modicisalibacter tunisiensis]MBZ9538349.1 AAA family ATPase [Modicisalibacter tunisiensis]MBZ9568239.1 AAA family ATPase [Modicisalibacter tunisiensis]
MARSSSGNTQLTLFGHFSLSLGEDTLTQFSYDKVKALLVYLLLMEQPVNRAALAELLWPDQGLSSGRTNLRHALHCLRQSLGDEAERTLEVSRQTIAFALPGNWRFDLKQLETLLDRTPDAAGLEQVLAVYRGDLVEDLQLAQCADYQRWLVRMRGEWRQRVLSYAEQVLEGRQELPDALLRTLVSRFSGYAPFHERLIRQLIEQGQSAAAHEEYNAYLQLLALSGQQPEPSILQLARYWSDGRGDTPPPVTPQGAYSRTLAPDSQPLSDDEIEHRQLSVMAIRLRLRGEWDERGEARACLALQIELLRWLERQCHHLGGFWLPGATGGLGLACFGTHGPAHQLAELVALYEHCRRALPEEAARVWSGRGEMPRFDLAAGLDSGRVLYLPERQLVDPLGQVTQRSLELMSAAEGSELVISQEASQHMPPALDLQPRLSTRLLASDGKVRLRALVLGVNEGGRSAVPPSLIGRESALRKLRDALARAGLGLRQSLLVQGASGMGKSALMVSFRQLVQSEDVALCWQSTTRMSMQEPFGLARLMLRWRCGERLDEASLAELLSEQGDEALWHAPASWQLLQQALGLAEVDDSLATAQSGEAVELLVGVLHRMIERAAVRKPLVLLVDDLQWIDEPSLKLLAGLQARLPINTAFLLVASHHGREPLPVRLHWDQQLLLDKLDAMQSSRLLSQLARRYRLHLSPRLRGQLIERCDGVPLYLQEICRRLDMDRREGRSIQVDELPRGLLGLLASRIDQLDSDRHVTHVAAVLGRQFRLDFLRECSQLDPERLKQALGHMQRLEIIERCDAHSEYEYQFTHPLLQEAAYLSCPRDVRTRIHQQVVGLIEERFPMWISRHPGDFATHLRRSGHYARGARYFELAAREALKVSANRTALHMADLGLASLRQIEGQVEREISLLTVRGQAAFALEGHGSPTAHESFVKARELLEGTRCADEETELEQRFLVKWGLWVGCSQRFAQADAFSLASGMAALAEQLPDPRYRRLAAYARAHCEYWAGRVRQALDHLEEIDPLHQPMMLEWLPFSDHPQVAAACYQGWALCLRGDYRRAEQQVEAAVRLAETLSHPGSLALALMSAAALYRQLGHVHLAGARAERAFELTRTPDLHLWHMTAQCALGWHRALTGDRAGLSMIEAGLDEFTELVGRDRHQRPMLWYIDACMALDELTRAEDYLDQCLMMARERGSLFVPELCVHLARVHHRLGRSPEVVRVLLEQALEQAREHENPHHQLYALGLWLEVLAPEDEQAAEALRQLLGEVTQTDAPVLLRWRTLLDQALSRSTTCAP